MPRTKRSPNRSSSKRSPRKPARTKRVARARTRTLAPKPPAIPGSPKTLSTGKGSGPREIGEELVRRFNRGKWEIDDKLWSPTLVGIEGGESGLAILPGQPDSSLLLQALRHTHPKLKMPKNGAKLDARTLANFAEWIRQGAPDPRTGPSAPVAASAPASWADTLAFRRQWWSFQPLTKPAVPTPKQAAWSTNAIDRFLLAKMESHNIAPGPDADPRTLIRRLTFALTGLPPKPEEVEAFVREFSLSHSPTFSPAGGACEKVSRRESEQ